MPDDRRIATLLAFARTMETTALDDALDLLDLMITDMLAKAKNSDKRSGCARFRISMRPRSASGRPAPSSAMTPVRMLRCATRCSPTCRGHTSQTPWIR